MLLPQHKPQPIVDPDTLMIGKCHYCHNFIAVIYEKTRPGEFEGTRVAECPACKEKSPSGASPAVWVTQVEK